VLFARINRRIERARSLKRLRRDNATLDARIVERAIQVGELRDRLARLEAVGLQPRNEIAHFRPDIVAL
jgi:hypothetical protein